MEQLEKEKGWTQETYEQWERNTYDSHFKEAKTLYFPQVNIITAEEFLQLLSNNL